MAKPGTIPVTVILTRDLRRWLESRAREEDKKLGPFVRKVLEEYRLRELVAVSQAGAVNPHKEE